MQIREVQLAHESQVFLRGCAILAVIGIHFFAQLNHAYTRLETGSFFIFFDQVMRFSVPLFIMLSGFSLTKKYENEQLIVSKFYERRILKLVPLFLIWSLFSLSISLTIPEWQSFTHPIPSVLSFLVYGTADYQLYFMPLIFQMYLLFPILRIFFKKSPLLVLTVSTLLQLFALTLYGTPSYLHFFPLFTTDHGQYVICISWSMYFVVGMWLAARGVPAALKYAFPMVALAGLTYTSITATHAVASGVDPLFALKFTRVSVITWTLPICVTLILFTQSRYWHHLPSVIQSLTGWLGRHSYLLFLSHTILLRILFGFVRADVPYSVLAQAFVAWCICIFISLRFAKET